MDRVNRHGTDLDSVELEPQDRYSIKFLYRLSAEKFQEMLDAQGGVCAICGQPPISRKRLSVDHDHDTDTVRGLLCLHCNLILGYARDDIRILARAAVYLSEHSSQPFDLDHAMAVFQSAAKSQGVTLNAYLRDAGIERPPQKGHFRVSG